MFNEEIKSVIQLIKAFPTEQSCIDHLEIIRWNGKVVSPFDASSKVWKCAGNKYQCKNTGKYFNVKTDTLFDNTKMELQKWFLAIWFVTSFKKGISSYQLASELNITQKSAWFMLQRIRACFGIENYNELDGTVEFDESYYGGKNKNRHADKKSKQVKTDKDWSDKVAIAGMIQRDGKMTVIAVPNTQKETIQPIYKKYIKEGSTTVADDYKSYQGLEQYFNHKTVKDNANGYTHNYEPGTHTNNIEGFWKHLKNCLRDNYNHVSRKHIQWYIDEVVFRFNQRKDSQSSRFQVLLSNMENRTTYKELIMIK